MAFDCIGAMLFKMSFKILADEYLLLQTNRISENLYAESSNNSRKNEVVCGLCKLADALGLRDDPI